MLTLGLETSCDETAASVVADGVRVCSNVVYDQHALHERYGGVVPEIASRAHLEKLLPVLREAMGQAGVRWDQLDAIAVGHRPGLIGSLLVGVSAAKALAWSLGVPLIGVDHVQAHLYAAALDREEPLGYPALGLVVSGGHTSLYDVRGPLAMTLIGRTIDDAVGEAYDKAAVILGLGYPGGPAVDRAAQRGDASQLQLPRSLLAPDSLDFSFSGLKTALLYQVRPPESARDRTPTGLSSEDLAASFQQAAVEVVMTKLERARQRLSGVRSVIVGGGVSANSLLRLRVAAWARDTGLQAHQPDFPYCVDNAAMIAGLGSVRLQAGAWDDLHLPAVATTQT